MAWCDGMEEPRLLIAPCPGKEKTTEGEGCILSLRHPKLGSATSYVFKDGALQELQWFKQPYGSFFLGDYVCENDSLYIATPVDPIFIFLPLFSDARMKKGNDKGMFRQLDEILYVEGYPAYQWLVSVAENSMQLVCEVKEIGSSKFFRLDDSKVLSWLRLKVLHLKASLIELDGNYAVQAEKETFKDSVSIMGEYLKDDPWLSLLCSHLQLELQEVHHKAPINEPEPNSVEFTQLPSPSPGVKVGNGKSTSSKAKQTKKLKTETNSHNIKDMFRRSTRNKS